MDHEKAEIKEERARIQIGAIEGEGRHHYGELIIFHNLGCSSFIDVRDRRTNKQQKCKTEKLKGVKKGEVATERSRRGRGGGGGFVKCVNGAHAMVVPISSREI